MKKSTSHAVPALVLITMIGLPTTGLACHDPYNPGTWIGDPTGDVCRLAEHGARYPGTVLEASHPHVAWLDRIPSGMAQMPAPAPNSPWHPLNKQKAMAWSSGRPVDHGGRALVKLPTTPDHGYYDGPPTMLKKHLTDHPYPGPADWVDLLQNFTPAGVAHSMIELLPADVYPHPLPLPGHPARSSHMTPYPEEGPDGPIRRKVDGEYWSQVKLPTTPDHGYYDVPSATLKKHLTDHPYPGPADWVDLLQNFTPAGVAHSMIGLLPADVYPHPLPLPGHPARSSYMTPYPEEGPDGPIRRKVDGEYWSHAWPSHMAANTHDLWQLFKDRQRQ